MTGADRPMRLHVKLTKQEHAKLKKQRGDNKWRPWLLSIPEQLMAMRDRNEVLQNEVNQLKKDNQDMRNALASSRK